MLMVGHIPTGWSEGEVVHQTRYPTYEQALEGHALVCTEKATRLVEEEREKAEAVERNAYLKSLADEAVD